MPSRTAILPRSPYFNKAIAILLIISALALPTNIVRADGYDGPNYTGGSSTNMGNSASWAGPTATFPWNGTTTNYPQSVIVMQSASVSAGALDQNYKTAGPAMAACNDGLGDDPTITPTYPQEPPNSESLSGGASKTQYTVQSGTASITLTSKATASASDPVGQQSINASGSYSAKVFPVTISIGGATSDGNGNYDILVGQHCTASLGGGQRAGSIPTGSGPSAARPSNRGDPIRHMPTPSHLHTSAGRAHFPTLPQVGTGTTPKIRPRQSPAQQLTPLLMEPLFLSRQHKRLPSMCRLFRHQG